jgi:hypothetical protein
MFNSDTDSDGCFSISDFRENDSVIVSIGGKRVKGRVAHANHSDLSVAFRTSDGVLKSANINQVVLLKGFDAEWL